MTWDGVDRRTERRTVTKLHNEDIDKIVSSIKESFTEHPCRFGDITKKDMQNVVDFTLKFKGLAEKTGMWVLYIIVTILTTGAAGLMALGLWRKSNGE